MLNHQEKITMSKRCFSRRNYEGELEVRYSSGHMKPRRELTTHVVLKREEYEAMRKQLQDLSIAHEKLKLQYDMLVAALNEE